jgi:response regulator of citrate/malate metabolism
VSASACGNRTGLARVSARRYLEQLVSQQRADIRQRVRHGRKTGTAVQAATADARTETILGAVMLRSCAESAMLPP